MSTGFFSLGENRTQLRATSELKIYFPVIILHVKVTTENLNCMDFLKTLRGELENVRLIFN